MHRRWFITLAGAGLGAKVAPRRVRAQGTTITVFWNRGFYPAEDQALQSYIDKWQKATGNRVELSLFTVEDVPRRTIAALQAGTPPDIAFGWTFDFNFAPRWAYDGKLVDVSDVVAPYRDQLLPVALDAVTYLNGRTNQRSIYAVPFHMQTHHIHYWLDILQAAGFKEDQIPHEWSAFWDFWCSKVQPAARRALNNRSLFGVGVAMSTQATDTFYNTQMYLNAYGVEVLDGEGGLLLDKGENRQRLIKALEDYVSIQRRGCTPPGSISWGDPDNNLNFHNRVLIMTPNPSVSIPAKWLDDYNQNRQSNPQAAEQARINYYERIRTIPWPDPPGREIAYPVAVKQAVIFTNSPHIEEAKSFLRGLTQPENIRAYTYGALGRWFPIRRDMINDSFWTDGTDPHRRVVHEQYTTRPLHVFPMAINYRFADAQNENVWGKALGRVIVDGWTMDRAVDELIARVKELLARN
jgi:multiple sugar transport system substrate-binding protein